ncbi:MAG: hypothetical protein U9R38_05190 [Candidatus Margulisiibacteriota bacterium]|nr:hypothetical protein [Candidatus Margulisiibacteriota bacterium]
MKKLFLFALLTILASSCFAGTMSTKKDIRSVLEYRHPADIVESQPIVQPTIITNVVEKEKPKPSEGFYTGFSEIYPILGYDFGDLSAELGFTSIAGDRSGIIKADWTFWRSKDKYTELKLAGAMYPGTAPLYGLLIGVEQYLTPSLSISGYIVPIKTGDGVEILSSSAIGMRLYF